MEFKITGRHIEITDPIEQYAHKKALKLLRFYDRIQSISMVIERHNPEFEVEVIVDVEHHDDLVAKDQATDLYATIDVVMDKAERQVHDHKEKRRNRKHSA